MSGDEIAVLGSGLIGLLTAKRLLDRGYQVRIHSASDPRSTASAAAPSMICPWLPYPPDSAERKRGEKWVLDSLDFYRSFLSGAHCTEIEHVEFCKDGYIEDGFPLAWMSGASPGSLPVIDLDRAVQGHQQYVRTSLCCVNSTEFLDDLFHEVTIRGGIFCRIKLDASAVAGLPGAAIFNCLGFGSGQIFGDPDLVPVFGQAVRMPPLPVQFGVGIGEFVALSTVYGLYLGSVFVEGEERAVPRGDHYRRIEEFAGRPLGELLSVLRINCDVGSLDDASEVVAGVRPLRKTGVRVDADDLAGRPLIHNYGHGARGWTLGWGSVVEAVELWESSTLG